MTSPFPRPLVTSAWYVVVATLVCLAVASPVLFDVLPADAAGLVVPIAQLTPFATALGYFLARRRAGFGSTFAVQWGRSWRAIGVGLGVVAAIGLLQLGASLLTGAEVQTADQITFAAVAVLPVFAMQCLFAVGEELGWRGWLVTQLEHRPFWQIAGSSSLAWVLWHLPALPLIVGDGGWEPGAAYLLAIATWAPFLVALRVWSGSVWPAVFVHGALNSIRVFLTQSITEVDGVNWVVEIAGCALWLVAAAVLSSRIRRARSETRSRTSPY